MKFAKKSLGQNFLIDNNIIKKILNLTEIKDRDIIEIGPGQGALTNEILKKKPKSLIVIEKDNKLVEELKVKYSKNKIIKIFNADILKFDIEKISKRNSVIFGNLPYNISSQILVKIIKFKRWPPKFGNLILMFQKELAEKIIGKFSTAGYGRLSILTSYRLNIVKNFLVSPNCFFPKPKINSMVVSFQPKNKTIFNIKNINNLEKITNILFSNKRKMINKNLKKILSESKIKKIFGLKLDLRPSEIKPEIFFKITELFELK
jgi:16S rRNA (adenine1518-N6/adenine1519-N6)-dimethyltransferase